MNIDVAKKYVDEHYGMLHHFCFRGTRNQVEDFWGIIKKKYPSVFLIELEDGSIKTFSYSDIIVHNLKIIS